MTREKSNHQNPGESSPLPWYKIDPTRLEEEKRLVAESYPNFVFDTDSEGKISWTGIARFKNPEGAELMNLKVKIECSDTYPIVFPKVHDVEKRLRPKNCPHLYQDDSICYGNRLDPELNFSEKTRIKDLIDYISIFLAKQWYFEKLAIWPGEHAHGAKAFLNYELKNGPINPDDLCPCGHNSKKYRECHLKNVREILESINKNKDFFHIQLPSKNKECPCLKGKKYKNCCINEKSNHQNTRAYFILKYPEWASKQLKNT